MRLLCLFLILVPAFADPLRDIPTDVKARSIREDAVDVSWRDPGTGRGKSDRDSRHYVVAYRPIKGRSSYKEVKATRTWVTLSGLTPKTAYEIKVKIVNEKMSGQWRQSVKVHTIYEPYRVRNLTAKAISPTEVALSWLPPKELHELFSGYRVMWEEVKAGKRRRRKSLVGPDVLDFVVKKLTPNTKYKFRVRMVIHPKHKTRSTIPLSLPVRALTLIDSSSPPSFSVQLIRPNMIGISYSHKEEGVAFYTVQYKKRGPGKNGVRTVNIDYSDRMRYYVIFDLEPSTTYKVRMGAHTELQNGMLTKWKSIFIPPYNQSRIASEEDSAVRGRNLSPLTPRNIRLAKPSISAVNIEWSPSVTPPCCPAVAYILTVTSFERTQFRIVPASPGKLQAQVDLHFPRTKYTFNITALNTEGMSPTSDNFEYISPDATPPRVVFSNGTLVGRSANLSCTVEGYQAPYVTWTAVSPAEWRNGRRRTVTIKPGKSTFARKVKIMEPEFHTRIYSFTSSLLLSGVTSKALRWEFSCTAKNSAGKDSRRLSLKSKETPNKKQLTTPIQPTNSPTTTGKTAKSTRKTTVKPAELTRRTTVKPIESTRRTTVQSTTSSKTTTTKADLTKPPVTQEITNVSVVVYTSAQLICEADGNPVPDIVWIHASTGLVYSEDSYNPHGRSRVAVRSDVSVGGHRTSSLRFSSVSPSQTGLYICRASSPAGVDQRMVNLEAYNHPVLPPAAISKIQVHPISPTRASINWLVPDSLSSDIQYYQVSYRMKQGGESMKFNTTQVGTELSGLKPSTTYLVGVTAGTMHKLGEVGPEVEVTTLSNRNLEPLYVSAKVRNSSIVQLDWEAPKSIPSMYIRGYNVYYKKEGEKGKEGQLLVKGSQNKQFLVGLNGDRTYYLRIATLTTWGYEARSPWIRIEKHMKSVSAPPKPVNVTMETLQTKIILRWNPPFSAEEERTHTKIPLDGYKIMYGPDDSSQNVTMKIFNSVSSSYTISNLTPQTRYIISIRAFNYFGGDSEPVYVRTTTLAAPPSIVQNAQAKAVSSTAIHVRWAPPLRGQVTRYHIRYWRPGRKDKESAWISGNFRDYVAGSLQKHSMYRFEIIPYSGSVPGESIVIFTHTLGDKPDGPPRDVSLEFSNTTTLVASWQPPHPDKANGEVTGYKMILRTKGGGRQLLEIPGFQTNYTFPNMKASRSYNFRVAAQTINGTGVFSSWVASRPARPNPPQDLSVRATVTSLTLWWKPPSTAGWPIHGYIVGYGQFLPEAYREIVDTTKLSYTINFLKPNSEYIVSVRAFNHIGESLPALSIARTDEEPATAPPLLAPVKLTAQSGSPTSLILSWVDPALIINDPILEDGRAYMVRYAPLSGEAYSYINTSDHHLLLSDLEPATKYEVSVKVVRGNGSSTWSLPVLNSTQETAPSTAPQNITVSPVPLYPTYAILRWLDPAQPNGKILDYVIYFTLDPEEDTKLWIVVGTDRQEIKIRDLIPHTTYYFKVQARNRAGYGPLSETVVYKPPTAFRATPTNVTVSGLYGPMSTTVRVAWQVSQATGIDEITGYMVYYTRDETQESAWLVQTERGLDTVIMDLDTDTVYYFKVQARYGPTVGPFSEIVAYLTESPEPRSEDVVLKVETYETVESRRSKSDLPFEGGDADEKSDGINDGDERTDIVYESFDLLNETDTSESNLTEETVDNNGTRDERENLVEGDEIVDETTTNEEGDVFGYRSSGENPADSGRSDEGNDFDDVKSDEDTNFDDMEANSEDLESDRANEFDDGTKEGKFVFGDEKSDGESTFDENNSTDVNAVSAESRGDPETDDSNGEVIESAANSMRGNWEEDISNIKDPAFTAVYYNVDDHSYHGNEGGYNIEDGSQDGFEDNDDFEDNGDDVSDAKPGKRFNGKRPDAKDDNNDDDEFNVENGNDNDYGDNQKNKDDFKTEERFDAEKSDATHLIDRSSTIPSSAANEDSRNIFETSDTK